MDLTSQLIWSNKYSTIPEFSRDYTVCWKVLLQRLRAAFNSSPDPAKSARPRYCSRLPLSLGMPLSRPRVMSQVPHLLVYRSVVGQMLKNARAAEEG